MRKFHLMRNLYRLGCDITFAFKNWDRLVSVQRLEHNRKGNWGFGEDSAIYLSKIGRVVFFMKHFKEVIYYSRDVQKLDRVISKRMGVRKFPSCQLYFTCGQRKPSNQ